MVPDNMTGASAASHHPTAPSRPLTRPSNRLFTLTTTALLALSLAGMAHLQNQFEADLESRLDQARRLFTDRSVLRSPSEPWVRFHALEDLAAKVAGTSGFSAITVTKVFAPPGVIRVVHPYYVPALYPQENRTPPGAELPLGAPVKNVDYLLPWDLPPDARSLTLESDGQILGYLHLRVDMVALQTVRAVLGTLFLLLVVSMVVLARQFRSQQQALSATTVELDTIRRDLSRLERLALAGQLSANLLHDLRKPVLNIRAELEDLETAPTTDEARMRMGREIDLFFAILRETGFERLLRNPGESEYVDLEEILERSLALVRYERRAIRVEREFEPRIPPLLTEPVRLIQVFSNLVLNAYQAMEGQGMLFLRLRRGPGHQVVVEVEDTGPGIPAAWRERIFDPFLTTRADSGGTGLGLYIVRETIRDLGGTTELIRAEGGACFRITLPLPQDRTPLPD
jgi:signal transduction histidine kinase